MPVKSRMVKNSQFLDEVLLRCFGHAWSHSLARKMINWQTPMAFNNDRKLKQRSTNFVLNTVR